MQAEQQRGGRTCLTIGHVAVIGAAATLTSVVALSIWPAFRHARTRRAGQAAQLLSAAVVRAVARIGAPPTALIGVRYAAVSARTRCRTRTRTPAGVCPP